MDGRQVAAIDAQASRTVTALTLTAVTDVMDALAKDAAAKLLIKLFPIRVMSEGDTVTLSGGRNASIAVGDTLTVFRLGDDLVDPDTGAFLGQARREVAVVRVLDVTDVTATARKISGSGSLAKGDIAEPGRRAASGAAPAAQGAAARVQSPKAAEEQPAKPAVKF